MLALIISRSKLINHQSCYRRQRSNKSSKRKIPPWFSLKTRWSEALK